MGLYCACKTVRAALFGKPCWQSTLGTKAIAKCVQDRQPISDKHMGRLLLREYAARCAALHAGANGGEPVLQAATERAHPRVPGIEGM
jgi:hypothetical protein